MTAEETIKILAILKAAYPNSYKNMTKQEAAGTVSVWSVHFANIPADVVIIAINKLIATSPFPPAISEVKKKIGSIYWEAQEVLNRERVCPGCLGDKKKAYYERLKEITNEHKYCQTTEPSLTEIIGNDSTLMLLEG